MQRLLSPFKSDEDIARYVSKINVSTSLHQNPDASSDDSQRASVFINSEIVITSIRLGSLKTLIE
jgi:hypothetical protein